MYIYINLQMYNIIDCRSRNISTSSHAFAFAVKPRAVCRPVQWVANSFTIYGPFLDHLDT